MADWESFLQSQMLPGEELISFVTALRHSFKFVPYVDPDDNHTPVNEMVLALTNRRLIARYHDGKVWKWFYTSALNSLMERKISQDKPSWPYQAILMIPGGLGLVIETWKVDKEQQEKLSTLLVQAFMKFSVRGEDAGAIAAIATYEEEKQRQQQAAAATINRKQ
jgi:hypothetical protein